MSRDTIRRAIRTFVQTAVALLVPGLFGWLNDLTSWAKAEGQAPFPDARSLAYLGVVAIVAGVMAAVNLLWNTVEDAAGRGFLRTVPPRPAPPERGAGRPWVLGWLGVLVLLVVVAVLVL